LLWSIELVDGAVALHKKLGKIPGNIITAPKKQKFKKKSHKHLLDSRKITQMRGKKSSGRRIMSYMGRGK
jgi:hypothetical protein